MLRNFEKYPAILEIFLAFIFSSAHMRPIFLLFMLFFLLLGCHLHTAAQRPAADDNTYLPPEVRESVYLGMPLNEFKKIKTDVSFGEQLIDYRIEGKELPEKSRIREITYLFDTDDTQPLYQIIIEYINEPVREKAVEKLLGAPNTVTGEWIIDTQTGFNVQAWVIEKKFIVVGKIKGTEWEE
jgi:hypothetical protein